jgi:hypothetical protein
MLVITFWASGHPFWAENGWARKHTGLTRTTEKNAAAKNCGSRKSRQSVAPPPPDASIGFVMRATIKSKISKWRNNRLFN